MRRRRGEELPRFREALLFAPERLWGRRGPASGLNA